MSRSIAFLTILLLGLVLAPRVAGAGTQDDAKIALQTKTWVTKVTTCLDTEALASPCSEYVTEWSLGNGTDIYLMVAQADPVVGIKALSCGVDYSESNLFVTWTFCGDGLQFPSNGGNGDWPAPAGGNRMTWETCQDATVGGEGVHAVAGSFYVYAYGEDLLQITPNHVIVPAELQVVDCAGLTTDLPDTVLGSVYFGAGSGFNPCGSTTSGVEQFAQSDVPISGTVSGTYPDTHASDDVYQTLTERESGGKKSNRYSFGEHRWSFNVAAGTSVSFDVEAYRDDNGDGDNFTFEYSTDGNSFTPILTINSSVEQAYSAALPASLSGAVSIRVIDSDQTPGNRSLDTVHIDWMSIETTTTPPSVPVAGFTGSPTSGSAPLTVSFTDQSTENPTSWNWNFGDTGTSTQQNPGHTYSTAGVYTVSLTVTNSAGSDSETKVDYITVTEPTGPVVHVGDMVVTRVSQGPWLRGSADVTVVDAGGSPVEGATVSGFFNAPNGNTTSAVTGSNGVATVRSDKTRSAPANWCFQVSDIVVAGGTYDPSSNAWLERCEDGTGIAPSPSMTLSRDSALNEFGLLRNYPNPLNLSTTIAFSVTTPGPVRLEVFDVSGRRVSILADETLPTGEYARVWDATRAAGGIYFYRLAVGTEVQTRKMLVVR